MELLLSNYQPAKFAGKKSSKDFFESNLEKADLIKIATGYISSDSLIELRKIIEVNRKPKIEMLIGMHFFDGFTRSQYNAAISLNKLLLNSNLGMISLSNKMKFHGKMYSFSKDGVVTNGMIGSSNFSSVLSTSSRLYETDFLFTNDENAKNIDYHISQLISQIGSPIEGINITEFNEYNSLLENHYDVCKLNVADLAEVWSTKKPLEFEIPIKTESKSNLNTFFGKGRINQRGFEMPRPWYEVELIIPKQITSSIDFPFRRSFTVITDDGWKFRCKTSGDFSKNFRSENDLKILGKWLKGRLENSGALTIGEPVTDLVLSNYGRKTVKLIATENSDVWLLDFKY